MQVCLMVEGQEGETWPDWVAIAEAVEALLKPASFRDSSLPVWKESVRRLSPDGESEKD